MTHEGKACRRLAVVVIAFVLASVHATAQDQPRLAFEPVAPRHGGTYHWVDGTWSPPGPDQTGAVVYSNTCQPAAGTVWAKVAPCNTYYDQGRIPSPDDSSYAGLANVTPNQLIRTFTFGYCTRSVTGSVDITLSFWETGGDCVGGTVPPASAAVATFDFGAAAGFPLPGSQFVGQASCWFFTVDLTGAEFCLTADGDGVWDDDASDLFVYSFHTENDETGVVMAGDPGTAPPGACIFGLACPSGCGTGLGTEDRFLAEELCLGGFPDGCYSMGGWPSFPYSSFYLELVTAGPCSCGGLETSYCTAGTSASGCVSLLSVVGSASASQPTGFVITASTVEGDKDGMFFLGTNGRQANPWGSGTSYVCVKPPVKRAGVLSGSGTVGACDGQLSIDLNAFWSAVPAKNPGAGSLVQAQLWYRDPASTSNQATSLSDGLEFPVCP